MPLGHEGSCQGSSVDPGEAETTFSFLCGQAHLRDISMFPVGLESTRKSG